MTDTINTHLAALERDQRRTAVMNHYCCFCKEQVDGKESVRDSVSGQVAHIRCLPADRIGILLSCIESGDQSAWEPLALVLEQQGRSTEAAGVRWLQQNGKRPKGSRDYPGWFYWCINRIMQETYDIRNVVQLHPYKHCSPVFYYQFFAAAILDAARAVGEAIERGEMT